MRHGRKSIRCPTLSAPWLSRARTIIRDGRCRYRSLVPARSRAGLPIAFHNLTKACGPIRLRAGGTRSAVVTAFPAADRRFQALTRTYLQPHTESARHASVARRSGPQRWSLHEERNSWSLYPTIDDSIPLRSAGRCSAPNRGRRRQAESRSGRCSARLHTAR
jgi:hypothetical protein